MIHRLIEEEYQTSLREFPVTAVVGPRQIGKTTLVRGAPMDGRFIYLDLERDSDINKLQDPELYLTANANATVILDEIQHKPELFALLRALVDDDRRPGRFVILGSASPALLKQSSESLAGRINYIEMHQMNFLEVRGRVLFETLWLTGGFPEPLLSTKKDFAARWYRNFINSYVQRELPMYGLSANPVVIRQLWQMLASVHGRILNYSTLAQSLGMSMPIVKNYVSFFENAFLVTILRPWYANISKRIVRSPKVYLRDTGVLHYLSNISSYDNLMGNILAGHSWEGFVIHQIAALLHSDDEMYYYRTQDGAEIDLLVRRNSEWLLAAEIKLTNSPVLTKGTWLAKKDLGLEKLYVITPGADTYPLKDGVVVTSLAKVLEVFFAEGLPHKPQV